MSFTKGFLETSPVAVGVGAYGAVLGVLAAGKGVSALQVAVMDVTIFSGSAQFIILDLWHTALSLGGLVTAILAINLRYLLVGASLQPMLASASTLRKLLLLHLVADENWAVAMVAFREGRGGPAFLFGGGVCVMAAWVAGTVAGNLFSEAVPAALLASLDVAFLAVFTVLAVGLWRGRQDALPWMTAALGSILLDPILPGTWHVLLGGAAGALVAVFRKDETEASR